ncbi:unnamed protein product, partial [Allacma fusca]
LTSVTRGKWPLPQKQFGRKSVT